MNPPNDVPISKILDYLSGNSGLTEKEIYQKTPQKGKTYTVLSSSTSEDTRLGEIVMCEINGKKLKVFEGKKGILVIRKGKAGKTIFLEKGISSGLSIYVLCISSRNFLGVRIMGIVGIFQ